MPELTKLTAVELGLELRPLGARSHGGPRHELVVPHRETRRCRPGGGGDELLFAECETGLSGTGPRHVRRAGVPLVESPGRPPPRAVLFSAVSTALLRQATGFEASSLSPRTCPSRGIRSRGHGSKDAM